jgi:hypothetical protein
MKMKNTCTNCIHWECKKFKDEHDLEVTNFGICQKVKQIPEFKIDNELFEGANAHTSIFATSPLITAYDFGCNQFMPDAESIWK